MAAGTRPISRKPGWSTSTTAQSLAQQAETTLETTDTIVASLVERIEAEGTGPEARSRFYRLMTSPRGGTPGDPRNGDHGQSGRCGREITRSNPVGIELRGTGIFPIPRHTYRSCGIYQCSDKKQGGWDVQHHGDPSVQPSGRRFRRRCGRQCLDEVLQTNCSTRCRPGREASSRCSPMTIPFSLAALLFPAGLARPQVAAGFGGT